MQGSAIQLTGVLLSAVCLLAAETLSELIDYTDSTQLCDYSDFCTSVARKKLATDRVPCCFSCFCSEFCWARHDCCPDVRIPVPTNILELEEAVECVSTSQEFVYGRRVAIHNKTMHLWMIIKCVGLAESHPYAEKCELNDDSSIVDLVPVWSPSTLDVYRNKYCAMCYNVSEYEFFSLDLGELQGYLDVNENVNWNIIDHIMRLPASTGNVLRVYTTNVTEVSYCNRTYISEFHNDSNINQYDEFLRNMCEAHVHPFYHDVNGHLLKNIYCYLFIADYHLFNETHGPALDSDFGQCAVTDIKLNPSSYTGIISKFAELLSFEEEISHELRRKCSDIEILDPYMSKCRPLLCPELSVPYNDVCYYIDGYCTPRTVSFHVKADVVYYQSVETTGYLIASKLRQMAGVVSSSFCSVVFGVNDENEDESTEHSATRTYFISVGLFSSSLSGFTEVRDIHEFLSSDFTDLGYRLTGQLLKGIDSRNGSYKEQWIALESNQIRECTGKFITILMWCPSIELSEDEFRYSVAHNILPADFEFNNPSTLAANGSAPRQICVRDYLHAWVYTSRASKIVQWHQWIQYIDYTVCMIYMYMYIG